jgi:hypothetical protein
MRIRVSPVLAVLIACASAPPPREKQPWSTAPRSQVPAATYAAAGPESKPAARVDTLADLSALVDRDPDGFVARYPTGEKCERAARALQPVSSDRAWKALGICVRRTRFTTLAALVDGAWEKDLLGRGDAADTVARVIAARGGDVAGDLAKLQGRRIPFFSLATAAEHPDVYKGRNVLFLARVNGLEQERQRAVAWLSEVALVSRGRAVEGTRTRSRTTSATARHGASDSTSERIEEKIAFRYDNATEETGLGVMTYLPEIDPFLEPGKVFLVAGKFQGTRPATPGTDEPDMQVVALSAYHPVASDLVP